MGRRARLGGLGVGIGGGNEEGILESLASGRSVLAVRLPHERVN